MYSVLLRCKSYTIWVASIVWLTHTSLLFSAPMGRGINVTTKLVNEIRILEQKLLSGQESGNLKNFSSLLSPFFKVNYLSNFNDKMYKPDFILKAQSGIHWDIKNIEVYESKQTAIAYLILRSENNIEKSIVDIWEPAKQSWQLKLRFESQTKLNQKKVK